MFCSKCGFRLNDDAIFCSRCGAKVASQTLVSATPELTPEPNHDALTIYIKDLLSLESIKRKYENRIQYINQVLSEHSDGCFKQTIEIKDEDRWTYGELYWHFMYENGHCFVYAIDSLGTCPETRNIQWCTHDYYIERNPRYLDVEQERHFFESMDPWMNGMVIDCTSGYFERRKEAKKAREVFWRYYEEFRCSAERGFTEMHRKLSLLQSEHTGVLAELTTLNGVLEKAYDVNIIPSQFRHNIYVLYYLYDFIRSSHQSLTTALLHCDLNEIKAKLNTIIEQQQEIIIQQAVIAAQNSKLLQQNQAQLEQLSAIEANTAQAAQYAEIAAVNAEACAWIGVANYLK